MSLTLAVRDPYEVLGVSRKATDAEIKKAFRNLAKKHHPDTHAGDSTKLKKFQEISAAYEVLGDKEKRAQFDRGEIDEQGNAKGFNPGAQGFEQAYGRGRAPGGGPGNFEFNWGPGETGGQGFRAEDIFADILGGLGGGGRKRQAQPQKGGDIQFAATVSLDEVVKGGTRRVQLGDGKQVEVRIPPGVKDGQQIRLRGQGAPGERGGPPGDVLISIQIAPHPYFTVEGRDLKLELPVTLKEAVLGAKVPVPALTGPVTLTIPANSNTGRTLRLKGKGLPGSGSDPAGDLYVRLIVSLPDHPDPKLEAFVKEWPADYDPRVKLK